MQEIQGQSCPYIRSNAKDRDTICTGQKHLRSNLPDLACPLWVEASQWARHVGIRGPFELEDFDSTLQPEAFEVIQNWVKDPRGLVLLASLPGRGKSHLAVGAWYALRRQLQRCYFTSSVLFQQLSVQASRGEDEGQMARFAGENLLLCEASFFEEPSHPKPFRVPVIFDDLGSERTTDTMIDYFERLLNYHHDLLITTNLDLNQLSSRYRERIVSRLTQASPYIWLDGQDWRTVSGALHD